MKRRDLEFETLVREALKGKKVPILVLDRRWHTLFPQGECARLESQSPRSSRQKRRSPDA